MSSAPLDLSGTPRVLTAGQSVCVVIDNEGPGAADVTLLHIGEDYSIAPLFPLPGESNRVEASTRRKIPLDIVTDGTRSLDRLIALAVPARTGMTPVDFSWAAVAGVPPDPVTRGTGAVGNPVWVRTFRWIAVPAAAARP